MGKTDNKSVISGPVPACNVWYNTIPAHIEWYSTSLNYCQEETKTPEE